MFQWRQIVQTEICWGWNVWNCMHFCWIAAALLKNIILHLAHGYFGKVSSVPLGVSDLRLTGTTCLVPGDFRYSSWGQLILGRCLGRWVPWVWCYGQLWSCRSKKFHMYNYILCKCPLQCQICELNAFLALYCVTTFVLASFKFQ